MPPKSRTRRAKKQQEEEDNEPSDIEIEQTPTTLARPFQVVEGLPVSTQEPDYGLLTNPLSIKDTAVLYSSLTTSRKSYISGNIFDLYWAKGKTKFENDINARDRMNKMTDCSLNIGPHSFDIRFYILKDDEIEQRRVDEKSERVANRLAAREEREEKKRERQLEKEKKKIEKTATPEPATIPKMANGEQSTGTAVVADAKDTQPKANEDNVTKDQISEKVDANTNEKSDDTEPEDMDVDAEGGDGTGTVAELPKADSRSAGEGSADKKENSEEGKPKNKEDVNDTKEAEVKVTSEVNASATTTPLSEPAETTAIEKTSVEPNSSETGKEIESVIVSKGENGDDQLKAKSSDKEKEQTKEQETQQTKPNKDPADSSKHSEGSQPPTSTPDTPAHHNPTEKETSDKSATTSTVNASTSTSDSTLAEAQTKDKTDTASKMAAPGTNQQTPLTPPLTEGNQESSSLTPAETKKPEVDQAKIDLQTRKPLPPLKAPTNTPSSTPSTTQIAKPPTNTTQPPRPASTANDMMQSRESQIMIANLNAMARAEPSLNELMKIVATGTAKPEQIKEFQGYIQRAKAMGPPPNFVPIGIPAGPAAKPSTPAPTANTASKTTSTTSQKKQPKVPKQPKSPKEPKLPKPPKEPKPAKEPKAPKPPKEPKTAKEPKDQKPPKPVKEPKPPKEVKVKEKKEKPVKIPKVPKDLHLTSFQEKYVNGADLVFEFGEALNIRYFLPKYCVYEKIGSEETLISMFVIHNADEIKRWKLKKERELQREKEKSVKQEEEAKKLQDQEKADKAGTTEKTESTETKAQESTIEAESPPEDSSTVKVEDADGDITMKEVNPAATEQTKPKPQTDPEREPEIKPLEPGEPIPYYSPFTFTLSNFPYRYDKILQNSFHKLPEVQRYMKRVMKYGVRVPKQHLWYSLDGIEDEEVAENLRSELYHLENPSKGKTRKRNASVVTPSTAAAMHSVDLNLEELNVKRVKVETPAK
ncbi:hypothetical protein WICPIJ_000153 [Wickerhamomyces pijperi]|uniref:SWR1-complex protein 3 n=1 Tax=Wickerhamomyces pijperi TaxID=599730 RepID=A0A9P8QD54_WICPI|nr:hypothetical protein WICPIJ_000153 [Wickerhamomyces pijperi]